MKAGAALKWHRTARHLVIQDPQSFLHSFFETIVYGGAACRRPPSIQAKHCNGSVAPVYHCCKCAIKM